jgi:non-specific serine/threonine protein kinase
MSRPAPEPPTSGQSPQERTFTLSLSPLGHLLVGEPSDGAPSLPALPGPTRERLRGAFEAGSGAGLLSLGVCDAGAPLPPLLGWWRDFAGRFVGAVCTLPEAEGLATGPLPPPGPDELQRLAWSAPPMEGAEYLSPEVLRSLWAGLEAALREELSASGGSLQDYLRARNPAWNLVGRVHLHLAENRRDEQAPFAFLATYSTRLSAEGKAQHQPLGQALREYASAADKGRLLALLQPLQRAAERCAWLQKLVDGREIFQPLRWSPAEAMALLNDAPLLEQAGLVVRMPASWRASRPPRAQVTATVGAKAPSGLGQEAVLDFRVAVALDGESLTREEVERLLAGTQGLRLLRGRWVEVDPARLRETLERFREVERLAEKEGLGFHEAMRLVAGAGAGAGSGNAAPGPGSQAEVDWSQVVAGPWLAETLAGLRGPQGLAAVDVGEGVRATLRPYQAVGVRWLSLLTRLRLGACLADDMGLGKTLQIIALLLLLKRQEGPAPSLLVAPASLLANWAQECERFAPGLRVLVAHPSALPAGELKALGAASLSGVDLVVTSYGALQRTPWLTEAKWRLAVLDEAQAIKNPGTRQTRAAKALRAGSRIALTGTPVENRLGDLWSIFDYANPGLLGGAKAFTDWTRRLSGSPQGYGPLRRLVQPYILRRLKTDRSVIADLPDKTELTAFCGLSRKQAVLYQQAVEELAAGMKSPAVSKPGSGSGMARRGAILALLLRLKQICNHPSQWLGDGAWAEGDSGKLQRLRELCEVVAAKQEKVLVFSQFRETSAPLARFLGAVFGRPGLVLTGETPVKQRRELVARFQADESIPFFVLSLKAGGSGLNLTAASHVVHFDRWWNPAVENQATDRAFRIGQTKNVLVHKFVCRGTVEEKIDALIAGKRKLSQDLLDGTGEVDLTSLADDELLRLVRLDLNAASAEG